MADLHDRLRELVGERVQSRELTGTELARRAGFQQAHISNFMNQRRGLSLEAMDRVLQVLSLEVRDLIPPERQVPSDVAFEAVPVVSPAVLLQNDFAQNEVQEYLRFKRTFLRRLHPAAASQRDNWQRFVLLRADRDAGEALRPRLVAGAMMLVDRHYNSLQPYRKREPNLYVVKDGSRCLVRYVELHGNQLTLRPENQRCALDFIAIARGRTFADYVVGRVAHVAFEM
ncbi:MAG: helix-turn-helix transcriptional regulator [Acidobacteriota bacterium]|nr:helix-turn-helix transcriptional regulator [Acidobacteriota bacterium]